MLQVAGGTIGAVILTWKLAVPTVSEQGVAIRVAMPLGYLPLLVFLGASLWAGVALWRGLRGGHRVSIAVALAQVVQINLSGLQYYLASPIGLYLAFPEDPTGSITWTGLSFEAEVGLKYRFGMDDGVPVGWVRLNVLALGLAVYLAVRVLDSILPPDRSDAAD